jgi:hypothetical protein
MAGRKKENFSRGRVEFKAPEAWVRRAMEVAERLGFGNLSAFVRFAVTDYMNRVAPPPPPEEKRKGKGGEA